MTKKIFYEKVGRRYKPVYEYDQVFMDAMPKGSHLLQVYPGGQSTRYNIDPAYAPMIAAGRVAEDAVCDALRKAAVLQRHKYEGVILTDEQEAAWNKFIEVMGDRGRYVEFNSVRDIANAGIRAMTTEAEKLLTHTAVKEAYEHFMLVCELAKEHNAETR